MLDDINAYLYRHIPITQHLGVSALHYDGQQVILQMPLAANLNHRSTAFGGSVATLGILAGWTFLHLQFRDTPLRPRLVIQQSSTEFIDAIDDDFIAVCQQPPAADWARFQTTLARRGKARLTLTASIHAREHLCARHSGEYVALTVAD